jgi:hypothetical protein
LILTMFFSSVISSSIQSLDGVSFWLPITAMTHQFQE